MSSDLKQLLAAAAEEFNSGRLEAYLSRYDPDVRFYGLSPEPLDLEGTKAFYHQLVSAFPDARAAIHDTIAEGDRIAFRYTLHGTHQGEFMGIAPTGRSVDVPIQTIFRFRDERIVERWTVADLMTLMAQLGAAQAA